MKVLFASSEIIPFASTGGLGDVAAALPSALQVQGVDMMRVLPLYGTIDREKYQITPCGTVVHVPLGDQWFRGEIWQQTFGGVVTYFIQNPDFFDRLGLYSIGNQGFDDNFERYLFFQKAIVRMIDVMRLDLDLVHCNDWHTGLLPMLLKYGVDGIFRNGKEKTLLTIHNLMHQGWAPSEKFYMTGLPEHCYTMHTLEFYGEMNCLKGGLVSASAINAVSPTYAKEIQTEQFGCRLEGVLQARSYVLHGILNGIDYSRWNPETDIHTAAHYSASDISGKAKCKAFLQRAAGWTVDETRPLLGMVTRLNVQKGIDLLMDSIEGIAETGAQLIVLGTGDAHYEQACREWADRWPDQVCSWIEFSQAKAHQIEAGADVFLMPSEFEPCGQNQLYSMRYGTLPLVHAVGGLKDTVLDASQPNGCGFVFESFNRESLLDCLHRALETYANQSVWNQLVQHAMVQNYSGERMAGCYLALYHTILSDA